MGVEVTEAHARQYANNLDLLAQQEVHKFGMAYMPGSYTGEAGQPVQQLGEIEMKEVGDLNADRETTAVPHEVPWIFPTFFYAKDYINRVSKLQTLVQLEGGYAATFLAANNRKKDKVFHDALGAAVVTGKGQSSSRVFPVGNTTDSSGSLTLDKTLHAQQIMLDADVDLEAEELHYAIGPRQWRDYLQVAEVAGIDTNAVKPLVAAGQRRIEFLGATFHIYTGLALSGGVRTCYAWCKSGMHFGQWGAMERRVEPNPVKHAMQVVLEDGYGAVRVDDAKVVKIPCTES